MKSELEQKIADVIIRLHYCKTHWYYPWCAWWLIKAKYLNPTLKYIVGKLLGEQELQRFIDRQIKSMQWTLKR